VSGALHVTVRGQGPDLVLLHGWAMHGGVFAPLLTHLEADFRLHCVDLPGHGHSAEIAGGSPAAQAEAILAAVTPGLAVPALWLGWSLGGLLALAVAQARPEAVAGLLLLASAPRFARAPDWPAGMDTTVLAGFARNLATDHAGTLQRFLGLQVMGESAARATLRSLREALEVAPAPGPAALAAGLAILREADLRATWQALPAPVALLGGQRDRLVRPAALEAAREQRPDARLRLLDGAGHAPFLTAPEAVAGFVREFARGA